MKSSGFRFFRGKIGHVILRLILFLAFICILIDKSESCSPTIPNVTRRLIKPTLEGNGNVQSNSIKNIDHKSLFSPPSYSKLIGSFVKFLVRYVLTKKWSRDLAIRRLDNLKTNLIKYYAKRSLFQGFPSLTAVSTARDKGIGFPSLEGALLSLAFLTFSVLLIDMIQTLLAKLKLRTPAATVAPAVMGRSFLPRPNGTIGFYMMPEDKITTLSSQILSAIEKPMA